MRTLPKPLPDELLYSALARATYRYGFWSPKRLLDILYGRRTVVAVPDLPSNLASLARATGSEWQLGVEEMAVRHTLFGYYTHFCSARQRKQVLAAMASDGGNLQVRLGICAGSARAPKRFHFCPRCHAADVARSGEAYWHRAHHLPGVVVCHLHGDPLVESDVPFRPPGRHAYLAAPVEADLSNLRPLVGAQTQPEVARAVAVRSFELLIGQPCTTAMKPDYRAHLGHMGSVRGRSQRLRSAFIDYFGESLLLASFGREYGDPLAWLDEVLRAPRRPLHPFKHVLMGVFINGTRVMAQDSNDASSVASGKRWGVYRSPGMRQEAASLAQLGLSTRAVAWTLDVDWKTAERLLAPLPPTQAAPAHESGVDRQAWAETAAANSEKGKKELRGIAPALYARLYRHDRAWLLAWHPVRAQSDLSVRRRIDWGRRDSNLQDRVRQLVAQTLQEIPPRRASKNHILGLMGQRALLTHRAALLPRATETLDALCETVESFQLRRLAFVLSQEGGHALPDWRAFRDAHIQPGRSPDEGQGIMERARRRNNEMSSIESRPQARP
ncbi:TnsD family Tn7-like transposition protein [Rhizobacter fulvus]